MLKSKKKSHIYFNFPQSKKYIKKKYLLIIAVLFVVTSLFSQKKKATKPTATSALVNYIPRLAIPLSIRTKSE